MHDFGAVVTLELHFAIAVAANKANNDKISRITGNSEWPAVIAEA